MSRPLLICDCDEVLMHMVVPFGAWLLDDHDIEFRLEDASFANALKRRATGQPLEAIEVWPLLDGFFRDQMHRQMPITGAVAALDRLSAIADIVILTNVGPEHQDARTVQLAAAGMPYRVIGSRGGKGDPVKALIADMAPSVTLFVDDLPQHHHSVAEAAPDVWRLHMVGEPVIAPLIPAAKRAHARIDHWCEAESWVHARLTAAEPAPAVLAPVES
jgi:hypothetical protein